MFDSETGLYYNWFRYYDSEVGRYLRADRISEKVQLFAYAGNNPVLFVDMFGLDYLKFVMTAPFGKNGKRGVLIWCKWKKKTKKPPRPGHWIEDGKWTAVSGGSSDHIPPGTYTIFKVKKLNGC